jgi:hypothetical protein
MRETALLSAARPVPPERNLTTPSGDPSLALFLMPFL